jgi:hypothetical protein
MEAYPDSPISIGVAPVWNSLFGTLPEPTGSTTKGFRFCLLHFPSSLPRLWPGARHLLPAHQRIDMPMLRNPRKKNIVKGGVWWPRRAKVSMPESKPLIVRWRDWALLKQMTGSSNPGWSVFLSKNDIVSFWK